jgi:hypothetical protein
MYIPVVGFLATVVFLNRINLAEIPFISKIGNSSLLLALIVLVFIILIYGVSLSVSIKILKSKEL